MSSHRRWLLAAFSLLLTWAGAARSASASGGLRTVALSGMQAPGTNETFGDVGYSGVSLNNLGETAFIASPSFNFYKINFGLRPEPIIAINDESVWTEAGGSGLRRIAQEGPGLPGDGTFAQLARPLVSDLGHTLFLGAYSSDPNPQFYPTSILRNRLGQADVVVAARGSIAPSTTATFAEFDLPWVNAHGQVAFPGSVNSSINNYQGIWAEVGGQALDLVARQGNAAPGTAGGIFKDLSNPLLVVPSVDLGTGGHVAFRGTYTDDRTHEAIWLSAPTGQTQVVVREGDAAPSTNATFRVLGRPSVNGQGDLAFSTGLLPRPNPTGSNSSGNAIWRYSADAGVALVAIQGQQAPGVDAMFASNHINFATFNGPKLGEGGHMTFIANLLNGNDMTGSIWLADPSGALKMAARAGDPAPGTDDVFADFGTPTVNARGQVAFSARAVDFTPLHHGIWVQDRNGVLQLVVKAGDLLDVSDDPAAPDLRTVRYLSFQDGGSFFGKSERITGFNDLGQVAFFARFTDGTSGVFVSNAVAVPEPSSLVVAFAPLALVARSRNRRRGR